MNKITSRENPLIKDYIKLRDIRKYRTEEEMFPLEGARLIEDALNEGVKLRYAFFTPEAEVKHPGVVSALIAALGEEAYEIPSGLVQKLCDTKASQGLFAAAKVLDKILTADKIKDGGKFLILDQLQDPGNVGTIIRAADAVGISGVFLCGCCDVYNPKVVRSTMGSLFRVPVSQDMEYREVISAMNESGIATYASVVDSSARSLAEVSFEKDAAVVIGNEGNGLSPEDAALCKERITIKMKGNINSLNAATAAGIILWEMMK